MPKVTDPILILVVALAVAAPIAGCGSTPDQQAAPSKTPSAGPTTKPTATPSVGQTVAIRKVVRADIARIMSDIEAAEQRGDVVDGVPVGQSSNPYDYVGISPGFRQLVALGKPALPAIVTAIESSGHNGLREYLLAAAGAQIDGDVPSGGQQTWDNGKEWARQYRASH